LKCETCNNSVTCSDNTKKPSELFPLLFCNTCKHNFTAQNIQLISYLYPENNFYSGIWIDLLCSNCNYNDFDGELGGDNDPRIYNVNCDISWSSSNVITYTKDESSNFNCLKCGALCVWDDDYIKGELMKLKAKYYEAP
jgi:C4-type Zn-finger protein